MSWFDTSTEEQCYWAVGCSRWHGGAPVWYLAGSKLADLLTGATEFLAIQAETEDEAWVGVYSASPDGKAYLAFNMDNGIEEK